MEPGNIKQEYWELTKVIYRVFTSEDGKTALTELDKIFNPSSLIGQDANQTYFNLGCREVICFIKDVINRMEKQND